MAVLLFVVTCGAGGSGRPWCPWWVWAIVLLFVLTHPLFLPAMLEKAAEKIVDWWRRS